MEEELIIENTLSVQSEKWEKNCLPISISELFSRREGIYLNEFNLFLAYFHTIPNFVHEIEIDCYKANKWFAEKYATEIKDSHYAKRYFNKSFNAELDDILYVLYEDVIVHFDTNCSIVRLLFKKTAVEKVEAIVKAVRKFRKRHTKTQPKISLLIHSTGGLDTKSFSITKPKLNIEYNYNDDFLEVHKTIIKRLSKKNDKGLVLLHGKPGTGKTSYIRYLISSIKKQVIFLPPNLAGAVTNPDLMTVLIDNPNCIFVIEDAENIVIDRERTGHSAVSALLNISDGLLSDCLNIQLICSFNTDIAKVDNALLRKGRLIARYEFKELEALKANELSKKLGFDTTFHEPATLTAIYNQGEKEFAEGKRRSGIGFRN